MTDGPDAEQSERTGAEPAVEEPLKVDAAAAESIHRAEGFAEGTIRLRPRKAKPLFARHPWVLDSAVEPPRDPIADGQIVDVVTDKEKFIARGVYNSQSRIRVRLYTWEVGQALDEAFWRGRLESAIGLRKMIGYDDPAGAARLVFSEADGLSGLVVDRYADFLVVQVNSCAMSVRLPVIVSALADLCRPRGILLRSESGAAKFEGMSAAEGVAWGDAPDAAAFIDEHGIRYGVDLPAGQKTGFYLDQRENRRAVAGYVRGGRVLDMFCYTGAFALTASRLGGAREVLAVDSSSRAVATAQANASLNGVNNITFVEREAFEMLDELLERRERFDTIVLDPPKFTRSRQSVDDALRAYHRLNRVAVDLLNPGGILATCSCSGNVGREDFLDMLSGVSQKTGRSIQVLEQRGASADHPVLATCLETEYLKCMICRVE